ncbi:MAG: hypothetical protein ACRC1H_02445, partial [Caldilineaceae bacterium]
MRAVILGAILPPRPTSACAGGALRDTSASVLALVTVSTASPDPAWCPMLPAPAARETIASHSTAGERAVEV